MYVMNHDQEAYVSNRCSGVLPLGLGRQLYGGVGSRQSHLSHKWALSVQFEMEEEVLSLKLEERHAGLFSNPNLGHTNS